MLALVLFCHGVTQVAVIITTTNIVIIIMFIITIIRTVTVITATVIAMPRLPVKR